nr:hypothetical protein [Methanocella conradii]
MGVPKTAENPALMPQMTSLLRSSSFILKISAIREDSPAPIWAHGPSFPAEPPKAMVIMVAMAFTGTTMKFIFPDRRWTASITFSVPCPLASGARCLTINSLRKSAMGRRKKIIRVAANE